MADPLSIVGLLLAVGGAAQKVLSYALEARDASQDANSLLTELLAIKGLLEQLQLDQQEKTANTQTPDFSELLQVGVQIVQNLRRDLEPPASKIRGVLRQLRWPLKKDDVRKHVERLERLKTHCLLVVVRQNNSNDMGIKAEMQDLRHFLEEDRKERQTSKLVEAQDKFLTWLSPIDTETTHLAACGRHYAGTNTWLLRGPLQDLINAEPDMSTALWLKGKSGSGKTILISQAIEILKLLSMKDEKVALAYFYCAFDNQKSQEPRNILGALLAQLSVRTPAILEDAQAGLDPSQHNSQEDLVAMLSDLLVKCSEIFSTVYVVVDAVNESCQAWDVAAILLRLAQSSNKFRFLFSSTEDSKSLTAWGYCRLIHAEMKLSAVNSDVQIYVHEQLSNQPSLKRYTRTLKADIEKTVLEHVDGKYVAVKLSFKLLRFQDRSGLTLVSFRYARWQIDRLAAQPTGRDVRKMLQTLPDNLNETYSRFLDGTPPESPERKYLRGALLWLCFAARPLRLWELAEAVVLEEGDTDIDNDDKLSDPEILVRLAHGLIDYNRSTGVVSLAHFSIKACLTSEWIQSSRIADFAVSESSAHSSMLRVCLTYLLFDSFAVGYQPDSGVELRYLRHRYQLMPYVADYWTHHLQDPHETDAAPLLRFLGTRKHPDAGNYGYWLLHTLRSYSALGEVTLEVVQRSHPVYYASSFGMNSLVKAIIKFDNTADLDAPGGTSGSRPIHVAGYRRRKDVSRTLIEAGADILAEDPGMSNGSEVINAVFWARSNGWDELLALIERLHPGSTRRRQPLGVFTGDSL